MADSCFVGIDFGACNLKVAKCINGKTRDVKLNKKQGSGVETPNVIWYRKSVGTNQVKKEIGFGAKESMDYPNKISCVKRKLERENWSDYIENMQRSIAASEAAEDIFHWIWDYIVEQSAKKEQGMKAVLTVPVSFSEVQKKRLETAARAAGIPVAQIITEPFAAMLAQEDLFDDNLEGQVILIFDFGGSTLDLSLLRLEKDGTDNLSITELAASGMPFGGVDIDEAIYTEIFQKNYAAELDRINKADDLNRAQKELLEVISSLKEDLFRDEEDSVSDFYMDRAGNQHTFELHRDEVTAMFDHLKLRQRITLLLDELFASTDEAEKEDVTTVRVCGGTAQIPYFLEMLSTYFGEDVFDADDYEPDDDNVYLAVARGAARYLDITEDENKAVELENVIPFSIGLARGEQFIKYINRNERYGFETPYISLSMKELKQGAFSLAVYQSFGSQEELRINDEDGAVFMGKMAIQSEKYTTDEAIMLKMKMENDGRLRLSFYELRADEIVLVESKLLEIGG